MSDEFGDFGIPESLRSLSGAVEGMVSQHATTSEIWSGLKDIAAEQGLSTEGWTIFNVGALRSSAAAVRDAGLSLADSLSTYQATGLDQVITADQIATPWYANVPAVGTAADEYNIRVMYNVENPEWLAGVEGAPETVARWTTISHTQAPQTVGELQDMIAEQQANDLDKYSWHVVSVGTVQILASA
jgi:hypothetical protein